MIIVSGEFEFEDGHDDALRAAMSEMMAESAKEEGCHYYRFFRDVEKPHIYHVYEEWESTAHLGAHAKSDHMGVFRQRLGEIGVKRRDVKMMEAGDAKSI